MKTDEDLDLSDLDLLNEKPQHARCTRCYPHAPMYTPFIALCGTRTLMRNAERLSPPPDACDACKRLIWAPCAVCGVGG